MTPSHSNFRASAFPKARIRSALAGWWDEYTTSSLRHPRYGAQVRRGGTVFDVQPLVSGPEAVIALLRLKPVLGFEAGSDVIQRDGYSSKKEFLDDLCSRLEAEFNAQSANAGIPKQQALKPSRGKR
jgi:hypothetical protein